MVIAPVLLASILILVQLPLHPRHAEPALATPHMSAAVAPVAPATTAAPNTDDAKGPSLAALEAKPKASLSIEELVLLSEGRAQHKRDDVRALSQKLQAQPELAKDVAIQAELLKLAADPDTAPDALGAMAHAQAPIGADLLYEVWTSRSASPGTAELARSLLYSHDVRPAASPALAVALTLRDADSCEALQAALPQALSDGDRRSLSALAKLSVRHGCGPTKADDCYACLRSHPKQVLSTVTALKRRRAPSYPAR